MLIDSHQHFWKYNPVRDSWIDESMQVIRKDFLPEDLKPILHANKVDGCVAIQADQSEEETRFLLDCAAQYPFIKGVVGWVDLRAEDVEDRLSFFAENSLFKGVRHIVQAEKDDFLLNKAFQHGISKLSKFGLTYDILVFPRQLPAAIEMVRQFPNQKFVLDHIAKPKVSEKLDEQWVQNMRLLATYPNVYCKLSGMVTEARNFTWDQEDFALFIETVVESFGIERTMFGSDWPVCLLAGQYKEVLDIVTDYFESYSETEKAKILGENAVRFYNLL